MITHHFSDVEQSTIHVVDGKLSDIQNFDEIALEEAIKMMMNRSLQSFLFYFSSKSFFKLNIN